MELAILVEKYGTFSIDDRYIYSNGRELGDTAYPDIVRYLLSEDTEFLQSIVDLTNSVYNNIVVNQNEQLLEILDNSRSLNIFDLKLLVANWLAITINELANDSEYDSNLAELLDFDYAEDGSEWDSLIRQYGEISIVTKIIDAMVSGYFMGYDVTPMNNDDLV